MAIHSLKSGFRSQMLADSMEKAISDVYPADSHEQIKRPLSLQTMDAANRLRRLIDAQASDYGRALAEIRQGRKQSHWMWYIFPQLRRLGYSETAKFYGINGRQEAADYLAHPELGSRLVDISTALLGVDGRTANQIMGSPDDLKLRSSMTLFSRLTDTNPVFQAVLDEYFAGEPDPKTLALLTGTD